MVPVLAVGNHLARSRRAAMLTARPGVRTKASFLAAADLPVPKAGDAAAPGNPCPPGYRVIATLSLLCLRLQWLRIAASPWY